MFSPPGRSGSGYKSPHGNAKGWGSGKKQMRTPGSAFSPRVFSDAGVGSDSDDDDFHGRGGYLEADERKRVKKIFGQSKRLQDQCGLYKDPKA